MAEHNLGRAHARHRRRARHRALLAGVLVALLAVGAIGTVLFLQWRGEPSAMRIVASVTKPPPLTRAEKLLRDTDDPRACVVSFAGDGISQDLMLQEQDALYAALPIPQQEGRVFAGWYATPEDAAAFRVEGRVNGSELVVCDAERQRELYGAWKTPEENVAENARIPILMYHQFTAKPEGEDNWLRGNYAYIGDFDAQMNHIATTGFYLPTWDELAAFIDGRLFLPNHSVIVTDDDADQSWFDLAAPVVDKYCVLATSFMITADRQDPPPSPYVLRRSHTHNMHHAGPNGKGMMVNATAEEIAADLEASAAVLGVKEVVAYPYGHYNDTTKQGMTMAGFELGRTVDPGYVTIGTDKLALPVVRINYGMGLDALVDRIG